MRTIVNISLPGQLISVVEDAVQSGNYATKSEFFRDLIRMWMEGRIAGEVEKSREERKAGKGKLLRSLKDLR